MTYTPCNSASRFSRNRFAITLFLLSFPAVPTPVVAAEDITDDASPFLRDGRVDLQLRSHYLDRDNSAAADSLSWAAGGWLAYHSGRAFDTLQLGMTAYTSQKLHGPADRDGASLLATGQRSYSVLGEAFAALRNDGHELKGGRFLVNQFELNPQDTRMTPRTFQGAALNGRIGIVDYFIGYIGKMKTRNSDEFVNVATVAGAPPTVVEPLWLVSGRMVPRENLAFGFSSYRIKDVLASSYTEAATRLALGDENRLRLGGQYMHQSSIGANLLTGSDFATSSSGIRVEWLRGPLTLAYTRMQTRRSAAYRTPFGSWQGYACRIITSFNRAGEQVNAVDAAFDFESLGVPGLALNGSATRGHGAISATTGAALPDNSEYDLSVDYRFSATTWPQWAQPLWLRARTALLQQNLQGNNTATREHHLILNYKVTL